MKKIILIYFLWKSRFGKAFGLSDKRLAEWVMEFYNEWPLCIGMVNRLSVSVGISCLLPEAWNDFRYNFWCNIKREFGRKENEPSADVLAALDEARKYMDATDVPLPDRLLHPNPLSPYWNNLRSLDKNESKEGKS